MGREIVSIATALVPYPPERVWAVVTDLDCWQWRSDLSRLDHVGEDAFTEYDRSGFPTRFTVTERRPLSRWAFDLDNANLAGRWTGEFRPEGSGTQVTFTETITGYCYIIVTFHSFCDSNLFFRGSILYIDHTVTGVIGMNGIIRYRIDIFRLFQDNTAFGGHAYSQFVIAVFYLNGYLIAGTTGRGGRASASRTALGCRSIAGRRRGGR